MVVHNCLTWDCLVQIFLQVEKISTFKYEYVFLESMEKAESKSEYSRKRRIKNNKQK